MFHVLIPARYASMRLPGKPLLVIDGRPLIQWTWERACRSGAVSVIVATDDERIRDAAIDFGADVAMTAPTHASGTDRLAEVVSVRRFADEDIVVNVQGDEPLIEPGLINALAGMLESSPQIDIATAAAPIGTLESFLDPNCVKVLCALDGRALYFSRAAVPWPRDAAATGLPAECSGAWRHIGIYAYRVRSLLRFAAWQPTALECIEKLEQLRALEHGMSVHVLKLDTAPPPGVDTPEDLKRLRALMAAR